MISIKAKYFPGLIGKLVSAVCVGGGVFLNIFIEGQMC